MTTSRIPVRAALVTAVALCTLFAGTTIASAKGRGDNNKKTRRAPVTSVTTMTTAATGLSGSGDATAGVLSVAQHSARYRAAGFGRHSRRSRAPRFRLEASPSVAATAIGIPRYQLDWELAAGISVAQVAVNHGVAVASVTTALTNDMNAQIAYAVVTGQISQAQADALTPSVPVRVSDFLAKVHRARYTTTTTAVATTTVAPTTTEAVTTTTEPTSTTSAP